MFDICEILQINQALSDITIEGKHFPNCIGETAFYRYKSPSGVPWPQHVGVGIAWLQWDNVSWEDRIQVVACMTPKDTNGPRGVIHAAYEKISSVNPKGV